jgi:hypothetical protein
MKYVKDEIPKVSCAMLLAPAMFVPVPAVLCATNGWSGNQCGFG